jgi:hypothetical protein
MTLKINEGLPTDFVPGKYAVLCGRGSKYTESTGNRRLKSHVLSYLKAYSEARKKSERSTIISKILASVKEDAPDGSFVKLEDDGSWWELDDTFARGKVGFLFRECLRAHQRSCTKAKYVRRKKKAAKGRRGASSDDPTMMAELPDDMSANSVDSKRGEHQPRQQCFFVQECNVAPHSSDTNYLKSTSLLEEALNLFSGAPADNPPMAELPDDMSELFEGDFEGGFLEVAFERPVYNSVFN